MSPPSRADCLAEAAQAVADGHARLRELVAAVGVEEAARIVHYPGHPLKTTEAIEQQMRRRLTRGRGAA